MDWDQLEESYRADIEAQAAEIERLRDALEQGVKLIEGDSVGAEWKRGCHSFLRRARAALGEDT